VLLLVSRAVMFGADDAFLTTILGLLRRLPIYPMFGRGLTRLQPAYVEDVAEAIARALQRTQTHAITFECGGPRCSIPRQVRMLSYEMDCIRVRGAPDAAERIDGLVAELLRIKRELEERLHSRTYPAYEKAT
jgi:uncharacterized protein YbjT (DUF2867 family)